MFDLVLEGLIHLGRFQLWSLLLIGVPIGIFMGALPGISASGAMALLLPFTYYLQPDQAVIFLMAIAGAAIYGGAIPAILFGMPGTPGSMVTTLDGHKLAQKGFATRALAISAVDSAIGAVVGGAALLLFSPQIAAFALTFSWPEFFLISCFALVFLACFKGDLTKGLLAGALGLLLASTGPDPFHGIPRLTFGLSILYEGPPLIVAVIGFLCFSEVLNLCGGTSTIALGGNPARSWKEVGKGLKAVATYPLQTLAGAGIGVVTGAVPGTGTGVANYLAYIFGKFSSKEPEKFGTGVVQGIIGPEAANSSVEGSSLILALSLGIPGGAMAAVVLAAFTIHGVAPGPEIFLEQGQMIFSLIWSIILGGFITGILGLLLCRYFAYATKIPVSFLIPVMTLFAVMGAYAVRNSTADVVIMIVFGFVGFLMARSGYQRLAVVFPFILGSKIEQALILSLERSDGSLAIFFARPVDWVLWGILACGLVGVFWLRQRMG